MNRTDPEPIEDQECEGCGETSGLIGPICERCAAERNADAEVEFADDILDAIRPQVRAYDAAVRSLRVDGNGYNSLNVRKVNEAANALAEAILERSDVRRAS